MLFKNMLYFVFETLESMILYDPHKFLFVKPVIKSKKNMKLCVETQTQIFLAGNILGLSWCSV